MDSVSPEAEGQVPLEIQAFIDDLIQAHDEDEFFLRHLPLPNDETYVPPGLRVEGRVDISTHLGCPPSLSYGTTHSPPSSGRASPAPLGQEVSSQLEIPSKASSPESPHTSHAMHLLEHVDSDPEHMLPILDFEHAGSSARRLGILRGVGDRRSLHSQLPLTRFPEIGDHPWHHLNDDGLAKGTSYTPYSRMEVDSPGAPTPDISDTNFFQDPEDNESIPEETADLDSSLNVAVQPAQPRSTGEIENSDVDREQIRHQHDSPAVKTGIVQSAGHPLLDATSDAIPTMTVDSETEAAFAREYVDFLVGDSELEKLFTRSVDSTSLGPERFRRNCNKILQIYAEDLKRQPASWRSESSALCAQGLRFLSLGSITMKTTSLIVLRYMENPPRTRDPPVRAEEKGTEALGLITGPENGTPCSSAMSESEPSHKLMVGELRVHIREGAAFQRLKRNLRNLIIFNPTLESVKRSTERMLDLLLGDKQLVCVLLVAFINHSAPYGDYQSYLERHIRDFGSKLKAEANSAEALRVAGFFETCAGYIGIRAAQRMQEMDIEAVLKQEKLFNPDRCVVVNETETHSQRPQAFGKSQQPLESEYAGARLVSYSRKIANTRNKPVPPVPQALAATLLLWVPITIVMLSFEVHDLLEYIYACISWPLIAVSIFYILRNNKESLTWKSSTARDGDQGRPRKAPRHFAYRWGGGHRKDIKEKLQIQVWKTYRKYRSSSPEEALEAIIGDNVSDIRDADIDTQWPAVASSRTFKEHVARVRDMAIPTFFSEARRLVSDGIVGKDPNAEAGKISLLRALEEVHWCFAQTGVAPKVTISGRTVYAFGVYRLKPEPLTISGPTIFGPRPSLERVSNIIKLSVEASSRSEWQWWPLQPPSSGEKVKDTECRMSWKCSCGTEREEIIPLVYAPKLSHLASQFPLSNEPPERPPSSLSSASSQDTKVTGGSESQSTTSGSSSATRSSSLQGTTAATTPSSSVISFGTPPKSFVFLIVKASRYSLVPIDVTEKKARDFFQAIVEEYNKKRGWWRRLLSIYVYSHSEFVKIRRYAPQSFDPGLRFSFPPHDESPHDKEYQYYPRPMPHAPVSKHMFNHLYNACYSDQGLVHKLHHAFAAPSCIIKSIPGKLLDGMPKRDRLVDEEAEFSEDQDVEVFWGLVAREQRSALRVVIYMLLGLGPSLWFMFQWLFGWGHDGDLQSASVPLTLSTTMLGVLWVVVYSGDGVREMEQPL